MVKGRTASEGLSGSGEAGPRGLREAPAAATPADFPLPERHPRNETLARQRLDQALFLAGVADRASSNVEAGGHRRVGDDAPVPMGL